MSTRKSEPARALTEHLGSCYGQTSHPSMVRGPRGKEYTFAQARKLVLDAVLWLHGQGWSQPDTLDLHTYGPQLKNVGLDDLQRALDDLVRTQDLTFTVLTPRHCRQPRPCYSATNGDYWDVPGGDHE